MLSMFFQLKGWLFQKLSYTMFYTDSWASVSRSMPPASAFRDPVSPAVTGAFRYRTGFPLFRYRTGSGISIFVHSGTGLIGCRQSDIPAFKKISSTKFGYISSTTRLQISSTALGQITSTHSARSHPTTPVPLVTDQSGIAQLCLSHIKNSFPSNPPPPPS